MHRAGKTVEDHALRRPFAFNRRLLTRRVKGGVIKIARHAPDNAHGSLAVKLLRTYAAQVEALARLRHGGEQRVIVQHVNVNEGGQAIVGTVKHPGEVLFRAPVLAVLECGAKANDLKRANW